METLERSAIAGLKVRSVTGQQQVNVDPVPSNCTMTEMIQGVLCQMQLPRNDSLGRPLVYHARLEREGRHLHGSELVGDALQTGDTVTLAPNIDAGGGFRD